MTIVEFLLARIAEDEAAARASGGISWTVNGDEWSRTVTDASVVYDKGLPASAQAEHIARHDPPRVLTECDAKRLIVQEYLNEEWVMSQGHRTDWTAGGQAAREMVIQCLASVYADHPDYDQTWKL